MVNENIFFHQKSLAGHCEEQEKCMQQHFSKTSSKVGYR